MTSATTTTTTTTAMTMDKPLWRDTVVARSSGHCMFCKMVQLAGQMMAIIANGPGPDQWLRAHVPCAEKALSNGEIIDGRPGNNRPSKVLPRVWWKELDESERRGSPRHKYAVFEGDLELCRLTVADEARGAVKGIEAYRQAFA